MRFTVGLAAALTACGHAQSERPPAAGSESTPRAAQPSNAPAASASNRPTPAPALPEPPGGIALAGVHIARGLRQPIDLRGTLASITREPEGSRAAGWSELEFSPPEQRRLRMLMAPSTVPLPFGPGDFVNAEIDCRKGGWSRICDAVFRDRNRRLYLAIAGSGDPTLVPEWVVRRGPIAFSEARAKGPKSVRHTYSLIIEHARQSLTVAPHEWQRLLTNDGAWFVEGHAVSWEGARPLDAPDYVHYAIVRVR